MDRNITRQDAFWAPHVPPLAEDRPVTVLGSGPIDFKFAGYFTVRETSGWHVRSFLADRCRMARLEPFFPNSHGKPRVDDRRVSSGVVFIGRNGSRWCDAPAEYGPHKTLCNRWKRWIDKGIFARTMAGLAASSPPLR